MPLLFFLAALFYFQPERLPPDRIEAIKHSSWHAGCPVAPEQLRLLRIPYWDYSGNPATGELIVNAAISSEVESIFRELHQRHFPIAKMRAIENYSGNDDRSMEDNNTSAFNCRDKTGLPGQFSNHSWGRAIDINPLTNPYVKGSIVLPAGGSDYLDRTATYNGGIRAGDSIVKLFLRHGWTWGGAWKDRQDYQHFEKPLRLPQI